VTTIGPGAFYGCSSLTNIEIPDGVTVIEYYSFFGCTSLSSITIPEGVTNIGASAFRDCTTLSRIVIPESVTRIDENAFGGCIGLSVHMQSTIPLALDDISAMDDVEAIFVPASALDTYKAAPIWSEFAEKIFSI
jgi:hypothetical protein